MGIQVANLAGMFADGQKASQDDRKRGALAKFLQPARAGDAAATSALYGAGASAEAAGAQDYVQGQQKDARTELGQVAAGYAQTKNPQLYARMRELTKASGINHDMPEMLTDPADIDGSVQFATAIAQAYGNGKGAEAYTLSPGAKRFGPNNQVVAEAPFAPIRPDYQLVEGANGYSWVRKPTGDPQDAPQGGNAPPMAGPSGASNLMGASFDDAVGRVLKTEGGYVSNDAGKGPTNFGINSAANPDVNVANLTADGAKDIYKKRYWDAINADQLPPGIRMAAFDAAVNMGPQKAMELVRASGGDPQKFAALRQQKYDGLVAGNPQKFGQYADGWRNRNQESAGVSAIPVSGIVPKAKADGAPSGYQWNADHTSLVPITGGPADRKNNPTPADQARGEMAMRKEMGSLIKDDRTVVSAYAKVDAAAKNPSAQNDLALIFAYMKMLDPGSVVREGEFANAQNAAGVDDRVRNAYNKAISGERLNPSQRAGFTSSARDIYNTAQAHIVETTKQYAEMADEYGYDPERSTGSKLGTKEARATMQKGDSLLKEAREAISSGAPKAAVRQHMIEMGFKNLAGRL